MKKKGLFTLIGSVCLSLVLAALLLPACAPKVEEEKVFKFLDIQPFSGECAPWGWPCNYSGLIALEDMNADGGVKVGGEYYRWEFVSYDNAYDPTITTTVTRKGVFEDGCRYMFVQSFDQAAAVVDLAERENVLILCSNDMTLDFLEEHPLIFQNYYRYYDSYGACLTYTLKKYPNFTKIASFQPDSLMGHHIVEAAFEPVTSELGLESVGVFYTSGEETDFYSLLTPILAKGVEIIDFGAMASTRQAYCIKQARELGFEGVFTHPDTLDFATVSEIAGLEAMEGNVVAPGNISMPTELGKNWADRLTARAGSMQFWTSYYYDALRLLEVAIEKADTFDAEEVAKVLPTVSYEGILGKVYFSETHQILSPMPITEIVNGEEVFQEMFAWD